MRANAKKGKSFGRLARFGFAVLGVALLSAWILPPKAEAYHFGHPFFYSSHFGSSFFFRHGPFFGPSFGPVYYRAPLDSDLTAARLAGVGALDLNIKPKKTQVFVDGEYVGRSGQFDGGPNYLWLPKGTHEITLYREGYETLTEEYTVNAGVVSDVKVALEAGKAMLPAELASQPAGGA